METYEKILCSSNSKFTKLVRKPEKFFEPNPPLFDEIKLLSKVLYDVGKLSEDSDAKTLPELLINNFDEEQVWAGLQLQNSERISEWKRKLSRLNLEDSNILLASNQAKQDSGQPPEAEDQDDQPQEDELSEVELSDNDDADATLEDDDLDMDQDILNDPDFQNMSDSEGDDLPLFEDLSEDEKSGDEDGTYRAREKRTAKAKVTEVDDDFFKLRDMEKFLEVEDRRAEKKMSRRDDEDDNENDEDDIDYFGDVGDDAGVMYDQFFMEDADQEPGANNDEEDGENDSDDEDDDEGSEEASGGKNEGDIFKKPDPKLQDLLAGSEDEEEPEAAASTHEKSQSRLKDRIKKLEEKAVGDKPWQMGGEVAAPLRPENSLLAEDLDYESGVRQAPVITEDVARKLEDIIKQRVKDAAWDDVKRKVKPVEDPQEYRKKLVLDQEKSKLSLAQVYEEEYLRVSQAQEKVPTPGLLDKENEETPKEVEDLKTAMRSLFAKLDTLTHFHFTPKQKSADVKIVRNVPSIAMEEVAPVGASNADLLAPAEVVDKPKGELMEDGDKTSTDKKRERRKKKSVKRAVVAEKERREKEREESNVDGDNRMSKGAAIKRLQQAEKQGSVKTIKETDKNSALKSSTAFFNSLQDEVKTHVKDKSTKNKKLQKNVSLAAIKL